MLQEMCSLSSQLPTSLEKKKPTIPPVKSTAHFSVTPAQALVPGTLTLLPYNSATSVM